MIHRLKYGNDRYAHVGEVFQREGDQPVDQVVTHRAPVDPVDHDHPAEGEHGQLKAFTRWSRRRAAVTSSLSSTSPACDASRQVKRHLAPDPAAPGVRQGTAPHRLASE